MQNLPQAKELAKYDLNILTGQTEGNQSEKIAVEKTSADKIFANKKFLIIFQPGAGAPAAGTGEMLENWKRVGLGGCTPEVQAYEKEVEKFKSLGVEIFIVSTMTVDEQKNAIKTKNFSGELKFIPDFDFSLKELFNVAITTGNGKPVYQPIAAFYDNGICKAEFTTLNQCALNATRPIASRVLETVESLLKPKISHESEPELQLASGYCPN